VAGSSANDMVKGRRTGQGRHSNRNGSTYKGDFVAGKAHGNGVKTWACTRDIGIGSTRRQYHMGEEVRIALASAHSAPPAVAA
jgi:hypothetical protein